MCASLFLTCLDAKQSLHLMQEGRELMWPPLLIISVDKHVGYTWMSTGEVSGERL